VACWLILVYLFCYFKYDRIFRSSIQTKKFLHLNLSYLISQPNPVPSHALIACGALVLGAWQLYAKKGNRTHKYIGYLWVSLMLYVSISSFWIHSIQTVGFFSLIHVLSCLTIWILYKAIRAAQQKNISKHQRMLKLLYLLGLVITGLLTFLPNRAMHHVILM